MSTEPHFVDILAKHVYGIDIAVTTEARWEDWLAYLIEGVQETAEWTVGKAEALIQLQEDNASVIRKKAGKIYSHELVQVIHRQPYCRIGDLVDAGIAKRQTASNYLKRIADIGILEEHPVGRDRLFLNRRMRDLLTTDDNEFAR